MSEAWIPITELPTSCTATPEGSFHPIIWDAQPGGPYIKADNIHVNTRRTGRLLRAAGFRGLTVRYHNETEEVAQPAAVLRGIDGITAGGAALGVGAAVKAKVNVSTSHVDASGINPELPRDYRWPRLVVELGRYTLGSVVSDARQQGKSRELAWQTAVDREIRSRVVGEAFPWLLRSDDIPAMAVTAAEVMAHTTCIAALGTEQLVQSLGVSAAISAAIYATAMSLENMTAKSNTGRASLREKRWSLLPLHIQPDRYAAAWLLSKLPLIDVSSPKRA